MREVCDCSRCKSLKRDVGGGGEVGHDGGGTCVVTIIRDDFANEGKGGVDV